MSEAAAVVRPRLLAGGRSAGEVEPRVAAQADVDPRVSMVIAVLGGRTVEDVAQEWDIESSLLHRWVRDFLIAGTAVVTNRPDPDEARQRDRFLAAFAHELRTPVSVAAGWAMMLREGDLPEDQAAQALETVAGSLDRLSEHIVDVEMAASVSLGLLRVHLEPLRVDDLCDGLDGFEGVREGTDLTVSGDPRLLTRVLRDMWATAHREPAPSSVAVDVVEAGSWHEIRVVREGHQISPLVIQALFDPFGANDDSTGVTLGLYMARALTVAHGGYLGAEGQDDTTVLIARLPRETADASDATRPGAAGEEGGTP